MADLIEGTPISGLPVGIAPAGTEVFPIVQAGATVQVTLAQLIFLASSSLDIPSLLDILTSSLTATQLNTALNTRINLVDAADTVSGSVNARVKASTDAAVANLASETANRITGDSTTLGSAQTYSETWAYSKSATDSAILAEGASLTTAFGIGDAATLAQANTDMETYTYSSSGVDAAIAESASELTTNYESADATTLTDAKSYTYGQSTIDGAFASQYSALTANYQSADTTTENNAKSYADAAVSTQATVQATTDGGLLAQYTVKVDANGYVAGYGLASTLVDGTPSSAFIIRADSFAVGPNSTIAGVTPAYTFLVQATATTIGGESVPAGVYFNNAYIQNGSFETIKLANQAITIPSSAYSDVPIVLNRDSVSNSVGIPPVIYRGNGLNAAVLISVTFTSSGAPVEIECGAAFAADIPGGVICALNLVLDCDGTILMEMPVSYLINVAASSATTLANSGALPPYKHTPGAGSHTYTLRGYWTGTSGATLTGSATPPYYSPSTYSGQPVATNYGIVTLETKK